MRNKYEKIEKEGCEPTYEELKPISYKIISSHTLSCEPTYEELKLIIFYCFYITHCLLRAYLRGIETRNLKTYIFMLGSCEPTYEELKHKKLSNEI